MQEQEEDKGQYPEDDDEPETEPEIVPAEAHRLWAQCLGELQTQLKAPCNQALSIGCRTRQRAV